MTPVPHTDALPPTMRAAVLSQRGSAGLNVRELPVPQRLPGEVLVRLHAAALNRVDLYMRDSGVGITHRLPMVLGVEGAGTVAEADAGDLPPGSKVVLYTSAYCGQCRFCLAGDQPLCEKAHIAGEHGDGTLAEYIVLPRRCVVPLPAAANLLECAAIGVGHVTAWRMLFGKRALQPGETVLVVGIGGGVAVACLQLARLAGAQVIVTSSSDEKLARAATLGARAGINYRTEPVAQRVLEITQGQGVDMVIDSVGAASWGDSLRSLRRGGRLITCGATTGSQPGADLQRLFIRQLEVYGSTGGSVAEFNALLKVYLAGGFRPVIDQCFPLAQVGDAFARLQRGEQFGKIVVTLGHST
jgi:NADPH:quinone reductase-like Zn-dependent oxidoreductase